MIHTSPKTQKSFQQDYDVYGDSYTEDTTAEQLKSVFERITQVLSYVDFTFDIKGCPILDINVQYMLTPLNFSQPQMSELQVNKWSTKNDFSGTPVWPLCCVGLLTSSSIGSQN